MLMWVWWMLSKPKSIEDAERVCLSKNINNYLILNDNAGAVTRKSNPKVQWFRGMHYSTRVKETDTANSVNWSSMMLARLTAYPILPAFFSVSSKSTMVRM